MSVMRYCEVYKAKDGRWYLALAPQEYGGERDAIHYGPFKTQEKAEEEIRNHANPGGLDIDEAGKKEPPEKPRPPRP